MPTSRKRLLYGLLIVCAVLTAVPSFAQVPRAVFAELSSATW